VTSSIGFLSVKQVSGTPNTIGEFVGRTIAGSAEKNSGSAGTRRARLSPEVDMKPRSQRAELIHI
jgi:hypothetical protein